MKSILQLFLLLLFSLFLSACNQTKNSTGEENQKNQPFIDEVELAKQDFVTGTENIHKKEKFMSENAVGYEITYNFGNLQDVLSIKATTDLSLIEVTSTNYGKAYYNGKDLLIDATANMDDKQIKKIFQMVYFYHAFFHLKEDPYTYLSIEETLIMEERFKYIGIENKGFHLAFFPEKVKFYIEDRTQILKGVGLETTYLKNTRSSEKIFLFYDRFITVNHVPVSLSWKFFNHDNIKEGEQFGEAKVTKIKFYDSNQLQLIIPNDAIKLKTSIFF